jgi:streptomycin 6-kinase
MNLPAHFTRTVTEVFDGGANWLEQLPSLIAEYEQRWGLRVLPPFPDLSYNYVAPAVRADGSEAVLKLGVPNPELTTEIEALRLYDGRGIARLYAAEPERGALLIERLRPGTMLSALEDDEQATGIAAEVMRELWRPLPPDHPFPTVADWAAGLGRLRARFDGGTGSLPEHLVDRAERLFDELLASAEGPVLLHGDLHHFNILRAERRPWLALDPKGVAGEPAYETGALLRNQLPAVADWPDLPRILARRVDLLSERLGFDRLRLIGWGLAQAVLSAWWSVEDQGYGGEEALVVASAFNAILR